MPMAARRADRDRSLSLLRYSVLLANKHRAQLESHAFRKSRGLGDATEQKESAMEWSARKRFSWRF